ncbi:hypothetical protein [Paraburkholderia diazotrophica]|uniref:hypothetical protein n=1 Tax=Paraburkholderia diazotrophica TaxID=667676 RepID=UPI00316F5207
MVLYRFDAWWSGLRYVRRSVVLRLLGTVIVFSCAITLILTAVQLYRDYERGIAQIQNRLVDMTAAIATVSAKRYGSSISRN